MTNYRIALLMNIVCPFITFTSPGIEQDILKLGVPAATSAPRPYKSIPPWDHLRILGNSHQVHYKPEVYILRQAHSNASANIIYLFYSRPTSPVIEPSIFAKAFFCVLVIF